MFKKPVSPVKPSPVAASAEQAQTALAHLEKGRYRDAIFCYKALLKIERRPEWLAGLAQAYAGRAQELAAKGMVREALDIWRSRTELCGTPLWQGPYVTWLISDGQIGKVLDHLAAQRLGASDGKLSDEATELEAQLAPALLSASPATLACLPAESLLLRHQPHALAALAAYAGKDETALEAGLAQISFRSPYRDLRSVLKALVLWESDPLAARAAMAKLPPDGAFEPLAAPLRTLFLVGSERLRHWVKLSDVQQLMALDLLGCPQALAPMLRVLAQADVNLAPPALFDLVQRNARHLPQATATQLWQWLAPWAKRNGCDCPALFGHPSKADQECATALAVEISGDLQHAQDHWTGAVQLLQSSNDAADKLRAAMILRRVGLSRLHVSSDGVLDREGQQMLTHSLSLDASECEVYLRLTRYWRDQGDLKRARQQLEAGLKRFPDHAALLQEAVEVALASGAFKKAATAARSLLEQDPLNQKVRTLVGQAHLSHAAKQIADRRLEAAKNEIKEAANWLNSSLDQGRMQLLAAWAEPATSTERLRLSQQAVTTWGGALTAGWRLMCEAHNTFSKVDLSMSARLLSAAGLSNVKVVTAAELLDWVAALEQAALVPRKKGKDAVLPWRKAITALAATPSFDDKTTQRICEALSRQQEHRLLESFANAARRRWPKQPIFVYHAVAARFGYLGQIQGSRDAEDLELALQRARQNKDLRLATRIEKLFEDDDPMPDFGESDFDDMDFGPDLDDVDAPFDPLKMDPAVFRKMIEMTIGLDGGKSFLKNAREQLGDAVIKQIEREFAGDRKAFLRRVTDLIVAEVASAVAQVKAAPPVIKNSPRTQPAPGQRTLFDE